MKHLINKYFKLSLILLLPVLVLSFYANPTKAVEDTTPILSTKLITPPLNSTFSSKKIDIEVEIQVNRDYVLNEDLEVLLVDTNKPVIEHFSIYEDLHKENYIVAVSQAVRFTSTSQKLRVKFDQVPFLYTGNNNYFIFLRSTANSGSGIYFSYQNNAEFTLSYEGYAVPLYRFWSEEKLGHFFTKDSGEKDSIIKNDASWSYEKIAYYVDNTYQSKCIGNGMIPIYRFYSPNYQHHFYTANAIEKENIITKDSNWSYEGVAFCAGQTKVNGTSEVYRFYSKDKNAHFFTISSAEKDSIIKNDSSWSYEGIAYYAFK